MNSLLKSTKLGKAHPVGVANPVCLKIARAVADALAEATAVAGVAADAIDPLPICFTVYDALDGEADLVIQRVASAKLVSECSSQQRLQRQTCRLAWKRPGPTNLFLGPSTYRRNNRVPAGQDGRPIGAWPGGPRRFPDAPSCGPIEPLACVEPHSRERAARMVEPAFRGFLKPLSRLALGWCEPPATPWRASQDGLVRT
jgi:hypothetical protein